MNDEIGLKTSSGEDVALKAVNVKAVLNGVLSQVNIEQTYINAENTNIEAVYTFPLPLDAVLLELVVEINGETLTGQVKPRAIAETQYEEAITEGDTAVLLTKIKDGLYCVNLGNLLAGESAIIKFKYAQIHQWQGDSLRFYLPTTLAPRYGNPIDYRLEPHQVPEHKLLAPYALNFELTIQGQLASAALNSPTHAITKHYDNESLKVSLNNQTAAMDRDLIVEFTQPKYYAGEGLWSKDDDKVVALTSFYPQIDLPQTTSSRCIKMVVDCSGSMLGDSITQAGIALKQILKLLNEDDWFNIILFGSHHKSLFSESVKANRANLDIAAKELANLNADLGGTEMLSALNAAYDSAAPAELASNILLITDGEIWGEEQLICKAQESNHRHFVVGVGSAVSEAFLKQLADKTGGASEFVTPNENMSSRIVQHFCRIKQSKLTQSDIRFGEESNNDKTLSQSLSQQTTIFAGDTVNSFAQLEQLTTKQATLSFAYNRASNTEQGESDKQSQSYKQSIELQEYTDSLNTLARLAAYARLPSLPKQQAIEQALKYQLITDDTHCILVKTNHNQVDLGLPEMRTVPHQIPAGYMGMGSVICEGDIVFCASEPVPQMHRERDYLDIPSFLRCEAAIYSTSDNSSDTTAESTESIKESLKESMPTSTGVADKLNAEFTPSNHMGLSEFDIFDLEEMGEDEAILNILTQLEQLGFDEIELVAAWLSLYNEFNPSKPLSRHVTRLARMLVKELDIKALLIQTVREAVQAELTA
ncbi:Vault protein inter-alpha-trypsin domain protein [Shewanella halifaxensis HAW-EB4]|uniref:Vault protein inter-alpha-trypsin domain protein n=1 Tax=Shewanella halifaxensis (strain HAW-EB4) TaxID=458817 RepID=B0TSG0_SHEHH|nr:VIT domain-containing protein [Shewanella halifaxensis]ABZ76540.1 Vault protein inter-alpha-trypsin domain protein [Shewanella halifaxensis HAW-EB4]